MKHEIKEIAWLIIYAAFIIGIASLAFGLSLGGFEKETILQKNMFYVGYGSLFLLGVIAVKVVSMFVFKSANKEIEGTIIHDPEQSILPNWIVIKSPWMLGYFCIILFGLFFWVASSYQTFFAAVPEYEQQFTKGADLFFSVYPASPVETLGAVFLISLVGLILGIMTLKGKLGKGTFLAMFIIGGSLISMFYGIINHVARYSGSDIAMTAVMVFWFILGLMTVLSGSVIPALIFHDLNNFFVKFSKLFSSDIVTFVTFVIIGIMVLMFLVMLFRRNKNK